MHDPDIVVLLRHVARLVLLRVVSNRDGVAGPDRAARVPGLGHVGSEGSEPRYLLVLAIVGGLLSSGLLLQD